MHEAKSRKVAIDHIMFICLSEGSHSEDTTVNGTWRTVEKQREAYLSDKWSIYA